ncbi:hypothetical protein CDN93_08820 [Escherichia coli]|uniref:Uncharacterized protein n=1 Tax=Shigella sonnei TaxID=624 RepID=A0A7Z1I6T3_SHISO|nr:hypothetical protein BE941_28440 [Escherichia coli]EFO2139595.1 hypothetical protein [Escherichia coli O8]OYE45006.1 hypothetical protein CI633_27630 [Shigella sonnei]AZH59989.1 hypothetical protein CRT34_11610 [Escherichia coli]EEW3416449.1 hypothetical protein [Escherichia coli]
MLHVSDGGDRLLQLTDFFITLFFVGDGVITVMIDRPRQADDDADNQSINNRGDSAHCSIPQQANALSWSRRITCP